MVGWRLLLRFCRLGLRRAHRPVGRPGVTLGLSGSLRNLLASRHGGRLGGKIPALTQLRCSMLKKGSPTVEQAEIAVKVDVMILSTAGEGKEMASGQEKQQAARKKRASRKGSHARCGAGCLRPIPSHPPLLGRL